MVKLDDPRLCVLLATLALGAMGCGGDDPPAEDDAGSDGGETDEPDEMNPDLAAACVDSADALIHLGSSDHGSSMDGLQHLGVLGDTVYGCAENSGVALWDVADLAAPRLFRGDPRGGTECHGLAVNKGSRRMAVARADEIELYSLEDETTPTLLGTHPRGGVVDLTFGTDGRLYAAAETLGLYAYQVDGDQLVEVARFGDAQSDARAVAASGSVITVAEGRTGVRTYELAGDTLVASQPLLVNGTAVEVTMTGFTAYVATLEGVVQVDAAQPATPRISGITQSPGTAMGLAVTDGALWLSDWTAMRAYDPATLIPAGHETLVSEPASLLNRTAAVVEDEGRVFVAHWNGLRTYAPCTPNGPSLWPEVERMEWNGVAAGETKPQVLVLRNLGNQPLTVIGLDTDHSMFEVEPDGFVIPAGGVNPVEITFAPTGNLPAQGQVIITSDDPDEPERRVSVAGNIPRVPVGSKVEPFHDVDTNGRPWRPKDLEGKVAMLSYFAFW